MLTESGTDLGATFADDEGALWYDFAPFQGAVSAGSAAPFESITVEAKLIAHTESRALNSGGLVSMGDPLDLSTQIGPLVAERQRTRGIALWFRSIVRT